MTTAAQVESYIKHRKKGEAITRTQIMMKVEGREEAVDKAISRVAKNKLLTRVTAGVYVRPKTSRFGNLPPSIPSIIKSLEEKHNAVIVPSGARAVNELGISTQLSMQYSFVSNKRITAFSVGKNQIKFEYKKALPEQVNAQVALIYSAMSYLGKQEAKAHQKQLQAFFNTFNSPKKRQLEKISVGRLKWMYAILQDEKNGSFSRIK